MMEQRVPIDLFWAIRLPVASHIWRDRMESSFCERMQLMAPRIPWFGKTVTKHHRGPCATLGDVHMDAVRFHRAMFYFAHCSSSMVSEWPPASHLYASLH